ncbi:MAG: type II toxin-antitoxin system VapC family toxin [Deltaproteobacteria bacterium]|nr:type II toxin-antitoxin system VapC family toxin [Deltaproteobacteria bacterium]
MNLLVDTNIFIDYLRSDKTVAKIFLDEKTTIYYSILTKKELIQRRGLSVSEKKAIDGLLRSFRPIRIDPQIAQAASLMQETYKKQKLDAHDAIIAATAWVKKMPLATRNVKHFRFIKEIRINTF